MRYFDGGADDDARKILNSDNNIYIFGGSTAFGYGVKNNQTIPFYLQELAKPHTEMSVLNFGTPAYDQIEKLINFFICCGAVIVLN